jgi:hypothetical protein
MEVYISHSRACVDEVIVRRIADGLRATGLGVWLDEVEVLPGQNWARLTARALENSQAMVVVITPSALNSSTVQQDIAFALGQQQYAWKVIPVVAPPADEVTVGEIPGILRTFHVVVMGSDDQVEGGIQEIARVLREAS